MIEFKVISVNISKKKGTVKTPEPEIIINDMGVENDAHAGDWHRQVSLLAKESIDRFLQLTGKKIEFGEFAENITTEGFEILTTKPGDKLIINTVELEVTQIGKECHGSSCAIFREVGKCIVPKEGIFCKVLKGGTVKPNDKIIYIPKQ